MRKYFHLLNDAQNISFDIINSMDDIKYIKQNLKQALLKSYYTNVYAQILPLEKLRSVLSLITIILYIILFSMLCYVIASIKVLWNQDHSTELFIYIVTAICISLIIKSIKELYKSKIKKFYPQIVKAIGLKYGTDMFATGKAHVIFQTKLFPDANQSQEDDIFFGEYKNVGFTIAETKIIDNGNAHLSNSEQSSPKLLFKGIIITLEANKKIKSTTLIKPKNTFSFIEKLPIGLVILSMALLGFFTMQDSIVYMVQTHNFIEDLSRFFFGFVFFGSFGYWFYDWMLGKELAHNKDLQKIKLEDVNFSKYYQAYSYDQVEGRYLLTSAFIDRFMLLSKVFHTKNLRCSFVNNNLVIAIALKKDQFEICGLHTSLKNPKHINKFVNQIVAILLIADYLKLYEKTGL